MTQVPEKESPKPGFYKHYKGNDYEVIGVAQHTETDEWLVVYRYLYGDFGLSVRPRDMFLDTVAVDGETRARFAYVGPAGEGGV